MIQPKFAKRVEGTTSSAIREIFKHLATPGLISFAGGNPGNFALPDQQIADIAEDLLKKNGKALLQYGATEGWQPLREALLTYILETFQAHPRLEQILITTGSMQGLDLLCRVLLDPGDVVLCESPVFLGGLQALNAYQAKVVPVPCDDQGMEPQALENLMAQYKPKLLYCIPTFQNPTGRTLSEARRRRVAELAAQHRVVVAEDDPYQQLRYHGESLPSIASFDQDGWVVLLGSFSKVISPGLRVGFMCGDRQLISRCVQFKQCTDVHTPNLNQAMVERFLTEGRLAPHLRAVVPAYQEQLHTMLEGLEKIPQVKHFTRPQGGLFVFVWLRQGLNAKRLFDICLDHGLVFVHGEPFYPEGGNQHTLRLNFTNAQPQEIRRGMDILSHCLTRLEGGS